MNLAANAGFEAAEIPGLRKAAILVMGLGEELSRGMFQGLGEDEVKRLTSEITRLGEVPAAGLTQVVTGIYGQREAEQ